MSRMQPKRDKKGRFAGSFGSPAVPTPAMGVPRLSEEPFPASDNPYAVAQTAPTGPPASPPPYGPGNSYGHLYEEYANAVADKPLPESMRPAAPGDKDAYGPNGMPGEEDESTCRTPGCDGDPDCGDSYDGYCPTCADRVYGDDDLMSDVDADADTLASAGMGTDEDYGYYGESDY